MWNLPGSGIELLYWQADSLPLSLCMKNHHHCANSQSLHSVQSIYSVQAQLDPGHLLLNTPSRSASLQYFTIFLPRNTDIYTVTQDKHKLLYCMCLPMCIHSLHFISNIFPNFILTLHFAPILPFSLSLRWVFLPVTSSSHHFSSALYF